ncbi:hypothetical protein [Streptomyces griseocarneus]|uniref:hypothetical protein n=1 Tax=Streptomyces griseocarneus TaxID=51201 RepID=UPI00167EEA34|nr:hypothetical protein [Streptomyces griseocarneus]MBZ6474358.1 hypothetical protein [Streptomyces griseocarneus]GHG53517.1 hypothetical protein GCM10018779_15560 [Streptomyces griseocarneus]
MTFRPAALAPAAGLLGALIVLGTAHPAAAHGDTIHFTVSGDRPDGHVRAVAAWDNDDDPVDEPVAGTLTAQDPNGTTRGPWQLVPVEGAKATYTTREVLTPGTWKITVHCGFPDLGHGEATVNVPALGQVPPSSPPSSSPAARSAPAPSARPAEKADAADGPDRTVIATAVTAAAVLAAALTAVVLVRRARRSGKGA